MSIYTAGQRVFLGYVRVQHADLAPLSCPKEEDCLKGTRKKIKGTALKKFVFTHKMTNC